MTPPVTQLATQISADESTGFTRFLAPDGAFKIYMHDLYSSHIPSVNKRYGRKGALFAERALAMAQPHDIVYLREELDDAYLGFLQELGVGPDRRNLFSLDRDLKLANGADSPTLIDHLAASGIDASQFAGESRDCHISLYHASPFAQPLAAQIQHHSSGRVVVEGGCPDWAAQLNGKAFMRGVVEGLGIPMAPGEIAYGDTPVELLEAICNAAERHGGASGKVFLRADHSANGIDNLAVDASAIRKIGPWLLARPHIRTYLVDRLVDVVASPNVQVCVHAHGHIEVLGVSDQRLGAELNHVGNAFTADAPIDARVIDIAEKLGGYLAQGGYRGLFGIDLIETRDGELLYVEINARMNGATYPFALADNLNRAAGRAPIGAWVAQASAHMVPTCFGELRTRAQDLLFSHSKGEGVVPYMPGMLRHGYLAFAAFAADLDRAHALERDFLERLHAR